MRPVSALVRRAPVVCEPQTPIREAALELGRSGASALVVRSSGGELGIVTDRDLRSRVATGEVPVEAPVSAVMSERAFTVSPDRLGADVLLDLLERGIRHVPVVDAGGRVLGVLDDLDLLASDARAPFRLRRAAAEATDAAAVAQAVRRLPEAACALFDAGLAPSRIALVSAAVLDAGTKRLVELAEAELGPPPPPPSEISWLALGSIGRREPALSSDADCALVWHGDDEDEAARRRAHELAALVMHGLAECGLAIDEHGVRADRPLFARSAAAWRAELASWAADPGREKAVIAASVLFDGRIVCGRWEGESVLATLVPSRPGRPLLTMLARMALAHRPPTGFRRDVVVAHDGRHQGTFDVKRGGVLPIVDLARWAGFAAGSSATGTIERLRAAAVAGVLEPQHARVLAEAWELLTGLRLEHQVECVRSGRAPDDEIDPAGLNPLSRRYLREAFRAVISVQRHVERDLAAERAFGTGRS
jgi:CBS domain-containing protein